MILKRWSLNLVGVMLSATAAHYGLQYLSERILMPGVAYILILLALVVGCLIITNYMGQQMFPPGAVEVIRPEIPRQPWAWLRPRGEGIKPGFPINKGQVYVGRDVKCEIMVNHKSVSRKHAEVVRLAEGYLLRDLSSRNGTFINGQRVEEHLLQDGDLLAFGDVQFHFQAPKRPEAPDFEEAEHLSVSQLLSPEPLPLETDYGSMPISDSEMSEGGTEVWRRNTGTQPRG